MKALLPVLLLCCAFANAQLSQFNFYDPSKTTNTKPDTVKTNPTWVDYRGYLDSGIIMWTADTIHWIPGNDTIGREINGYYFDPKTRSYLKK